MTLRKSAITSAQICTHYELCTYLCCSVQICVEVCNNCVEVCTDCVKYVQIGVEVCTYYVEVVQYRLCFFDQLKCVRICDQVRTNCVEVCEVYASIQYGRASTQLHTLQHNLTRHGEIKIRQERHVR